MSAAQREPSADQLLAMAYVDGELAPAERAAFEARLAEELPLAREVGQLRGLELLARHAAPPEPLDHEWARIAREPLQRVARPLSRALIVCGLVASVVGGAWLVWRSDWPTALRIGILLVVAGVALASFAAARARARLRARDPYTHVRR